MSDALLRVRGLDVVYRVAGRDLPALRDVSLDVGAGEIVGLVGESGSGKSTVAAAVLRILASNGRITGGSVELDGRNLTTMSDDQIRQVRGADIAMIFQDPLGSLNPTMPVGRQLMHVATSHPHRIDTATEPLRKRILQLFDEVGLPDAEQRFDDYPHQFSGGMRQRIMVAMALLLRPALIIADEATSALDVTLQAQVLDLFRQVRDRHGTSILLVSHDLGVVATVCDRAAVMYAGQVVERAATPDLFGDPSHPYSRALIDAAPAIDQTDLVGGIPGRVPDLTEVGEGCSYAPRCDYSSAACSTTPPMLQVADHREVRCVLYAHDPTSPWHSRAVDDAASDHDRTPASRESPLLVARGVSKNFDAGRGLLDRLRRVPPRPVRAVDDVDLTVHRGEIVGLVGESGCGKTTLALTLLRLTEASEGQIEFDGLDLRRVGRRKMRQLRGRMQIILQDPVGSLAPHLRVRQLLREPYIINRVTMPHDRVTELLDLVGLGPDIADKRPSQLSGGQARRVSIARALALEPALIVADEPTAGLDVSAAAGVIDLMKGLRDRLGVAYLLITHDLNVVSQIADRIAVMYLGEIVESGSVQQILREPVHPYTQGLLAAVPRIGEQRRSVAPVPGGEMPSPRQPPPGCRFHERCPWAIDICTEVRPSLEAVDGDDHSAACHRWRETRSHPPTHTSVHLEVSRHTD